MGSKIKKEQFDEFGNLWCYSCKIYKNLEDFQNFKRNKWRACKQPNCKKCSYNLEKISASKNKRDDLIRHLNSLIYGCRSRSKDTWKLAGSQRGKECSIVKEDLLELWYKQEGKCALSGIIMENMINGGYNIFNTSVDRIDTSKGYVKENIRLVCNKVNIMRSNMRDEELLMFCKAIVKNLE
jgi:hypothetical protein